MIVFPSFNKREKTIIDSESKIHKKIYAFKKIPIKIEITETTGIVGIIETIEITEITIDKTVIDKNNHKETLKRNHPDIPSLIEEIINKLENKINIRKKHNHAISSNNKIN
jgi:hypothetical protein